MFQYEDTLPIQVQVIKPDARYYLLLDRQLQGCKLGLDQAAIYIRQAFMIHNQEFHDIYMRLAAKILSDMEILSQVIHQMHGEDDRYYDESNDDTPVFELIMPLDEANEKPKNSHHVNNDLSASVIQDIYFEEKQIQLYDKLITYIDDEGAKKAFTYIKENRTKSLHTLQNLMTILTTHTETKDFGLGDSHNAFDLDTSNYFDKPNPTFINPSDIKDFEHF